MDDYCFLGRYPFKIDPKGRINIPSKLREQLPMDGDRRLVILKGIDPSVWIYPIAAWKREKAELIDPGNQGDPRILRYRRILTDGAGLERPDDQGRIPLPPECRAHADLKDEVIIVGGIDRIEVWNPRVYEQVIGAIEEPRDVVASSYRERVDELRARRKDGQR